jgi:hypothetical protein
MLEQCARWETSQGNRQFEPGVAYAVADGGASGYEDWEGGYQYVSGGTDMAELDRGDTDDVKRCKLGQDTYSGSDKIDNVKQEFKLLPVGV